METEALGLMVETPGDSGPGGDPLNLDPSLPYSGLPVGPGCRSSSSAPTRTSSGSSVAVIFGSGVHMRAPTGTVREPDDVSGPTLAPVFLGRVMADKADDEISDEVRSLPVTLDR